MGGKDVSIEVTGKPMVKVVTAGAECAVVVMVVVAAGTAVAVMGLDTEEMEVELPCWRY